MKKIIYTDANGRVCVVHPQRNTWPEPEELSDAEVLLRAAEALPEDAINPRVVEEHAIPTDRANRASWVQFGGNILICR